MDQIRPSRGASATSLIVAGGTPPRMLDAAERAVAEPFVGIATTNGVMPGLFRLEPTGVATTDLVERARRYLAGLTPTRRELASFEVQSDAWRRWSNIHRFLMRHGVLLEHCSPGERELALALVASALSEHGFAQARDVMRLNDTLRELTGSPDEFGGWLYWVSVFGEPSPTEPWGFQFDGHHVNLNCLVLGDQLVVAPYFLGSEPVRAESGRHAGTSVLEAEERGGMMLMAALSEPERARAVIASELPREMFTAAFRDNVQLDYAGISYPELSGRAQQLLVELIGCYIGRIRPGHAEVKMAEIHEHLDQTWFAWMGGVGNDDVFYYRIHSPVVLIEFDHQSGVVFDNDYPTRRHIHTVVRTPNGNDYGKDLLRQHYAEHDHSTLERATAT